MDQKDAFEQLMAKVDEDKRDEVYAKVAAVETRAEKLDIFKSYGVETGDVFGESWSSSVRELTDEELDQVAGGEGWWEETWHSRDSQCEP